MNFGFLDLEMNCDGKIENEKFIDDRRMKRYQREIISVGFVVCDDKYKIKSRFSSFVKPVHNDIITDYCSALTGITQENVNGGKKCNNAFGRLNEMCKRYSIDYIFVFGDFDKIGIISSIKWNKRYKEKSHHLYAVLKKVIDIKPIILKEINHKSRKKTPGLLKIAENLKIECKVEHHNALSDANLLCEICKRLNIHSSRKLSL